MSERILPAPQINAENRAYFDAAARGTLLVKHCGACGNHHHYPRALCPFCMSEKTEWTEASGRGTVYSYTVTRRGVPVPYALAYVTLEDKGVTMMTNIVDCDLDTVRIGDAVKAVFKPSEDGTMVPCFTKG